jgi:hypothetical protein
LSWKILRSKNVRSAKKRCAKKQSNAVFAENANFGIRIKLMELIHFKFSGLLLADYGTMPVDNF